MSEGQPTAPAALAVQETNFVNSSPPQIPLSAKNKNRLEQTDSRVIERVAEFAAAYPDLAQQPVSETHGRRLREEATNPKFIEQWVSPEDELKNAFKILEEEKREAVTWLRLLHRFLLAHSDYEGLAGRFEPVADHKDDEFYVEFNDAWGPDYMDREYARAKALDRQVSGGTLPTGSVTEPEWENPATCMLTLSASSIPSGNRLPGVDHLDQVHDSFTKEGVRQTLRNTLEYHLGLDNDDSGYWLQAEPHGAGSYADPDKTPGPNACYTHVHVAVYFDAADLVGDLQEDTEEYQQRWESIGSEFERVIDKHLAECPSAGRSAHNYEKIDSYLHDDDGCISLNPNVENLGSYLAAYLGGYKGDLFERSIEYIAWGALYWATARQRTTRSQRVNHAIRADACQQRAESPHSEQTLDHGETVEWNHSHGPDVVCSSCGSGWQIDQDRLEEPTPDQTVSDALADDSSTQTVRADGGLGHADDQVAESELAGDQDDDQENTPPGSLADRWPTADSAFRVGESLDKAAVRGKVEDYLKTNQLEEIEDLSVPRLLGQLSINPIHADYVVGLLDGTADDDLVETFRRNSGNAIDEWELVAIVDSDGEEHTPGNGGVNMQPLNLPVQNIVQNTRLRHDLAKGEHYYDRKTGVAFSGGCPPENVARFFVEEYGITDPRVADSVLGISDHYNLDRDCMAHPEGLERFGNS